MMHDMYFVARIRFHMSINFRNLILAIRKVIRENVIATFEKHQYTLKESCVRYIFSVPSVITSDWHQLKVTTVQNGAVAIANGG